MLESGGRSTYPFFTRIIEDEGNAEMSHCVVVLGADTGHSVVGSDDEKGVAKPRLGARSLEKLAQRHIGISDECVIGHIVARKL